MITLLFSLLTYDYAASHTSNEIIKYADDTTVVGLIKDEDDAAYRMEVEWLTTWCRSHSQQNKGDGDRLQEKQQAGP